MASRSEILALKRSRVFVIETEIDDDGEEHTYSWLRTLPSGPHAPNKNESHVMRRLMSQTGLTEEQLREHKKYRQILAQESRRQGDKTQTVREVLRIRKRILRELMLPKEHPAVKERFISDVQSRRVYVPYSVSWQSPQALWQMIEKL
jgi:hypothetical protein